MATFTVPDALLIQYAAIADGVFDGGTDEEKLAYGKEQLLHKTMKQALEYTYMSIEKTHEEAVATEKQAAEQQILSSITIE